LLLCTCCFVLYSSSRPLDLPSVPTRRSSDLVLRLVAELGLTVDGPAQEPAGILHGHDAAGNHAAGKGVTLADILDIGNDLLIQRDRKSTRLNSSHASISYAVFCLKQKNYNPY